MRPYASVLLSFLAFFSTESYAGPSRPVVAVFDSGIDYDHPVFKGRIAPADIQKEIGFDAVDGDNVAQEGGGSTPHGTMVSSVVAMTSSEVAIYPVRLIKPDRCFLLSQCLDVAQFGRAVEKVKSLGIRVVNFSFGAHNIYEDMLPIGQAILNHPEILFVLSAGNEGLDNDQYPTFPSGFRLSNGLLLPNILSVAALNATGDGLAYWGKYEGASNWGKMSVHIAAPGTGILVAVPGGGFKKENGTSFAAPYVATFAAKIFAANPKYTPTQVIEVFKQNTDRSIPYFAEALIFGGPLDATKIFGN